MTEPSAPVASRDRVDAAALDDAVARYRRAERIAAWTLALAVAGAFLAAVAALSFWPGLAVGLALFAAVRVPAFRRGGTVRLRTDAPPEAAAAKFASPTPPVLALQWGAADAVETPADHGTEGGREPTAGSGGDTDREGGPNSGAETATYAFSALSGLRTASIDLDATAEFDLDDATAEFDLDDATAGSTDGGPDAGGASAAPVATVSIEGTAGGKPWGSYAVAVREAADGGSVVDVRLRPTRRFGLRRLPQGWAAERYYADAMAAQGYEVVERSVSMTR